MRTYGFPGVYTGDAQSVVVAVSGVKLQDMNIAGNLTIAEAVGDGEVHVSGVKIGGKLDIQGGGRNSVYLENCDISEIVVTKNEVRVVFADGTTATYANIAGENSTIVIAGGATVGSVVVEGDAQNANITVESGAVVENVEIAAPGTNVELSEGVTVESLTVSETASDTTVGLAAGAAVTDANISGANANVSLADGATVTNANIGGANANVSLADGATVTNANIGGANANVNLAAGATVDTLNVASTATGATVATEEGSKIGTATISAASEFTGAGTITNADIKSNDVVIEAKPENVNVDRGVNTNVAGNDTSTPPPSPTVPTPPKPNEPVLYWSVTFDGNGNDGGTVPSAISVVRGNVAALPGNTGTLTKANLTFAGWSTDKNTMTPITNYRPTANATLYAVWSTTTPITRTWAANGKAYAVDNSIGYDDNGGGGAGAFRTDWTKTYGNGPVYADLWDYQYNGAVTMTGTNETTVGITPKSSGVVPWNSETASNSIGIDVRVPEGYTKVGAVEGYRNDGTGGAWKSFTMGPDVGKGANINSTNVTKGSDVAKGAAFTTAGEGVVYLYPQIKLGTGGFNKTKFVITWEDSVGQRDDLTEIIILDLSGMTKVQKIEIDSSVGNSAVADSGYVRGLVSGGIYKVVLSGTTTGTNGTYYVKNDGTCATGDMADLAPLDTGAQVTHSAGTTPSIKNLDKDGTYTVYKATPITATGNKVYIYSTSADGNNESTDITNSANTDITVNPSEGSITVASSAVSASISGIFAVYANLGTPTNSGDILNSFSKGVRISSATSSATLPLMAVGLEASAAPGSSTWNLIGPTGAASWTGSPTMITNDINNINGYLPIWFYTAGKGDANLNDLTELNVSTSAHIRYYVFETSGGGFQFLKVEVTSP